MLGLSRPLPLWSPRATKALALSADLSLLRYLGVRLPHVKPHQSSLDSRLSNRIRPCCGGMGVQIGSLDVREMSLVGTLILDFAINWLAWGVAAIFQTEKFYDLTGSISYVAVAFASLLNSGFYHARQIGATSMVTLWTVRLGGFLFYRALKTGSDSRFEEAKKNPGQFFVYWTLQAVWVWVCSLPVILLNGASRNPGLGWTDVVGIILYTTGLLTEAIADFQKFGFKKDPANKGRFVDVGLWQYARFPQYFGEMVTWWGIFLTCANGLRGWEFVSVASPLFVMFLLLGVSGIPIQEKQAKERWGTDPEYLDYCSKTNLLVPIPKFWRSSA